MIPNNSTLLPEATAKHPRGLYTLFFTEMWERFSYYGMRALLVLFMVDAVESGGLGFDDKTATSIYGLYTAFVYLVALPGGWIADRLLGAQRAVWYGGIIIALGHFTLAIPTLQAFFLGLVLVVLGTGLLKPNISAMVGQLYPEGGARRDAGFTIFYMGINLGAALGPLICSTLGEKLNWHYGFAAAGVGMAFGLIQFKFTSKHLGTAGLAPHRDPRNVTGVRGIDRGWYYVGAAMAVVLTVVILGLARVITFNPIPLAQNTTYVIVGIAMIYFIGIFAFGGLNAIEKQRVVVIIVLLFCAALFWSGFEQAGSSLNLFADRYTDRMLETFAFEIPTGWFQMLNPVFIITLAPIFAALWVNMARRHLNPAIPMKFAFGLILLGAGFLVMVAAAKLVVAGDKVAPFWLIFTYLLHTMGELCLSPVGLSAVSKLAPARFVGQMMGLWFVAASLGNLIAGLFAGEIDPNAIDQMPDLYLRVVITPVLAGVVMLILVRPIKKLLGGVQ
ncbi:MAG: peptide MFS transporter [Verrucomicrobia bacterium]|nr:peptide MFS transporter [Verrucomicrobiota bacterium]